MQTEHDIAPDHVMDLVPRGGRLATLVRQARAGRTGKSPEGGAVTSDPVVLARQMGFEPDEHQTAVLRSTAKQGILNCSRQWGKSTTAAAMAVHRALTRPKSLVVVASPSEKQSAELVKKAADMVAVLGVRTKRDGIHKVSMVFPNGSRIVGVPGNPVTVRGLSKVSLLLIDEAALVPEELYDAVRPFLAVANGDLWLMSTPWASYGFFYNAWTHGGAEWERICVKATDCPRISPEFLEKERRIKGGTAFRREYMAEFMQDDDAAFDTELVLGALDPEVATLEVDWREYRRERLR